MFFHTPIPYLSEAKESIKPKLSFAKSRCARARHLASRVYLLDMRELRLFWAIGVCVLLWPAILIQGQAAERPTLPPGVVNTQDPKDKPLLPEEAVKRMTLPEGFGVSLFAGEPDVMQPIAFDFDDRGRLWVVECFSYPDWKNVNRDRILIFTDKDGDGRFDERKVFFDKGNRLSGTTIGFVDVWVTSAPILLFIPDENGDDIP